MSQAGTLVDVTEDEYSIILSKENFSPGTYTFVVVNAGKIAHNLHVSGPDIEDAASANMAHGDSTTLTVTFGSGEYHLFCGSGTDREKGMDATIIVP